MSYHIFLKTLLKKSVDNYYLVTMIINWEGLLLERETFSEGGNKN